MATAISPDGLKEKLDAGERVFVKVWQKGCGPCKMSAPAVERIEAENKHDLTFVEVCLDDYPEFGEVSGVEAMPAFFVFAEKSLKGKQMGFKGIAKLQKFLEETLPT